MARLKDRTSIGEDRAFGEMLTNYDEAISWFRDTPESAVSKAAHDALQQACLTASDALTAIVDAHCAGRIAAALLAPAKSKRR